MVEPVKNCWNALETVSVVVPPAVAVVANPSIKFTAAVLPFASRDAMVDAVPLDVYANDARFFDPSVTTACDAVKAETAGADRNVFTPEKFCARVVR